MCFVISFFISKELTGEIYWPNYLLSYWEDEGCWQDHVDEHNHIRYSHGKHRFLGQNPRPTCQLLSDPGQVIIHQSRRKRPKGKAWLILCGWKCGVREDKSRNGICMTPPQATVWKDLPWKAFNNSSDQFCGRGHGLGSIFFICRQSHFVIALLGSLDLNKTLPLGIIWIPTKPAFDFQELKLYYCSSSLLPLTSTISKQGKILALLTSEKKLGKSCVLSLCNTLKA